MCIYIVVDIVMAFFVYVTYKSSVKNKNMVLYISAVLWILVFGLRGYFVGNDTPGYAQYFSGRSMLPIFSYGTLDDPEKTLEEGFLLITRFLGFFSSSPTFLFLIHATFFFTVWILYLKKVNPQNALWCMLLFFVLGTGQIIVMMVALRQSLSICFLLLGVYMFLNIQEKRSNYTSKWPIVRLLVLSISVMLFSISVHRTSILVFPVIILLLYVHIPQKVAYCSIIISAFISIFIPETFGLIFDFVLSNITAISNEKVALLGERYAEGFDDSNVGRWLALASRPAISLIMVYFMDKKQLTSLPYKCLVVATVMSSILVKSTMMERLVIVFQLLGAGAYVPNKVKTNSRAVILIFVITLLYLFNSYRIFENWDVRADSTLPYKFVWE